MNIKKPLVKLSIFILLFNQFAFLMPTKTEAALPAREDLTLALLAAGERSAILTGTFDSSTTNNNGTEWYYWPGHSMGFAPGGDIIDQTLGADTITDNDSAYRLSWHMWPDRIVAGYRAGDNVLNWSDDWSRFIYQSDSLPAYYPSGPQTDVPSTDLEGWSLCYVGAYTEQVYTSILWSNRCTGTYLLFAGADYVYSPDKVDVLYSDSSVLDAPGGAQLESPLIHPGYVLDFNLYKPDGITQILWNDYLVYISGCDSEDCGLLNNPLDGLSNWSESYLTDNTGYIVPTEASGHYLAIIPADDQTNTGEPLSIVYLQVMAPIEHTVSSCEELQAINSNLYDTYTLTTDLDCADTATWNDGDGFIPIGTVATPFMGEFVGDEHTVSNLHVNSGADYAGLFGVIGENSSVTSLYLTDVDINGRNSVGGMVGMLIGDLLDCSTTGNVAGASYVGGLAGYHDGNIEDIFLSGAQSNSLKTLADMGKLSSRSDIIAKGKEILANLKSGNLNIPNAGLGNTIIGSRSTAAVSGSNSIGGLVGYNLGMIEIGAATGNVTLQTAGGEENSNAGGFVGVNSGLILGAYATGNVTGLGDNNLGGFSGYNDGLLIMGYATGNVSGDNKMGGFTGLNDGGIAISYARGSVTGDYDLGGFAGRSESVLFQVYSTGAVSGTGANLGGMIGYLTDNSEFIFDEDSTYSFWDNQTSGQSVGCGNTDCSDIIFGRSTAAMKLQATYTTEFGDNAWDFEDSFAGWGINPQTNDGYPYLRLFDQDGDGSLFDVEDSGPNNGDANDDGMLDGQQENVVSFISNQNNLPEVLQVPEVCSITSFNTHAESGLLLQDAGFNYPAGLTSFTINCGEDNLGYTADVTLYFYGLDPTGLVLRKHNTTNNSYATITPLSLEQVTIGGIQAVKVVYQVTDGGLLDQDGVANGIIVDPVGLGINDVGVPNTGLGGGL